ncbi:MAG: DUF6717 family protein [Verrucomicrobiota bacterium]
MNALRFILAGLALLSPLLAADAPSGNALCVIQPYFKHGTWVFDDQARKLVEEPFVAGVPEIINAMVADIPDAKKGFRLTFSGQPFPGHELTAQRGKPENGGFWYHIQGTDKLGWLCPALFKYFEKAPTTIYAKADAIPRE